MRITFLGTGTSMGVPEVGCTCDVCTSLDSRDKRLRSSALVEVEGKHILIDCGPDIREQCLVNKVKKIDAVIITHEHYDHIGGLDDLRPFCKRHYLPLYMEQKVIEAVQQRMPYCFVTNPYEGIPLLEIHPITTAPFCIDDISIIPIRVMHARLPIVGYRINNIAYITDLSKLPCEEISKLQGLDVLIINALRYIPHFSHQTVQEALELIALLAPKRSYLIHANHQLGLYSEVQKQLPENVFLTYDGLVINV